jgi:hypothetical protein
MLAKRFEHILHDLGMAGLEHPLFYHAPVGIRFKIGGEEPIYLDRSAAKLRKISSTTSVAIGTRPESSGTSGGAGPSADRRVSR